MCSSRSIASILSSQPGLCFHFSPAPRYLQDTKLQRLGQTVLAAGAALATSSASMVSVSNRLQQAAPEAASHLQSIRVRDIVRSIIVFLSIDPPPLEIHSFGAAIARSLQNFKLGREAHILYGPAAAVPASPKGIHLVHDVILHELRRLTLPVGPLESATLLNALLCTPVEVAEQNELTLKSRGEREPAPVQWGLADVEDSFYTAMVFASTEGMLKLANLNPKKVSTHSSPGRIVVPALPSFAHIPLIDIPHGRWPLIFPCPQIPRTMLLTAPKPPVPLEITAVEMIIDSIGSGISGFNRYLPTLAPLLCFIVVLSEMPRNVMDDQENKVRLVSLPRIGVCLDAGSA